MGAATNETAKKFQKSYFDVLGLCCSSEVPLIENILKSLDGIKHVSVIVPSRTVIVVHDHLLISQIQIVKALNQARLEANVRVVGEVNYKKKWPSPFAMICGVLLVLSFFKYIYHPFQWVALGAVAVGIFPIALKAVAAIRNMRLDINILALVAVIGTIVLKDYLEAATIVFLFTIAEWLESRASHKATAVMSALMSIAPQKAVIAESGEVVDAEKVKLNTIIAVKAGEIIPIDGIVVEGKCEVDQKTLTGESFPVVKQKDSTVLAGTINLDGYIGIRTTALAEDCLVAKMAKLVEDAQNNKSRTQKFIDKCAKYYTPGVLIMSVCIAAIPAALRAHNQDHWFHLALVVLISACPCALILSTPVATFCALSKAATCGILIKGGDYLEILAKIKIMAFDKTGTITRGEFVVTHFRSLCDDISSNTLLYWVSSIESKSSHPMAAALVDYSRLHSIEPKIENVMEFQNFPGEGICGKIDGKYIYVGNTKISQRAGSGSVPELEGDTVQGKTIGYIYNGATPVGIFKLSDVCRSGVVEAINGLKSLGIKIAMLTGDSHAAAIHAQNQLGNALEVIHAELLPDDKAELIRQFKKEGPTAMIGDGINDAPALATADVGFSMGISGSALATESGHVILMSNDLQKIPKAVRLARKTQTKVIQNVILSITTKAAIVALAIAGHPLVWAAVLADVGTCLLVIFNSMLLLGGTHKHEEHCRESSKTSHYHEHKNCMQSAPPCSRTCGKELHHVEDHGCAHINHVKDCIGDEESGNVGNCMQTTPSSRICVKELHNVENHGCAHNHVKDCIRDEELGSVFEPSCANEPHVHKHICSSTSQPGNKCAEPSVGHEVKHGKEKCSTYKVMTCDKELHNMTNHGCANKHVKGSVGDEELGNVVEPKCCEDREVCCESKENCTKLAPPHNAAIDMAYMACCSSHVETKAVQTCMSFEKREIGGCCKSFRKECCTMHGHFGAAFGGGLSEIITE